MKLSFWLQFGIQEGIMVGEMLIGNSKLSPDQKAAAANFIHSGQALLASFQSAPALPHPTP